MQLLTEFASCARRALPTRPQLHQYLGVETLAARANQVTHTDAWETIQIACLPGAWSPHSPQTPNKPELQCRWTLALEGQHSNTRAHDAKKGADQTQPDTRSTIDRPQVQEAKSSARVPTLPQAAEEGCRTVVSRRRKSVHRHLAQLCHAFKARWKRV